ncbi:MAG: plastocyanin/azurin family copper-binding protein [Gammaproteobacteria bacterium]
MFKASSTCVAALLLALSGGVAAEDHVIEGVVTQWRPMITFAQPGDGLTFKNMTGHDTETIEGMIPEGAAGWKAKLGEEAFHVTLDKEGVYIFKCNPHITTGMVGVVVVGDARPPQNLEQLQANLDNVKIGKNMVNRALKKLQQALDAEAK